MEVSVTISFADIDVGPGIILSEEDSIRYVNCTFSSGLSAEFMVDLRRSRRSSVSGCVFNAQNCKTALYIDNADQVSGCTVIGYSKTNEA